MPEAEASLIEVNVQTKIVSRVAHVAGTSEVVASSVETAAVKVVSTTKTAKVVISTDVATAAAPVQIAVSAKVVELLLLLPC